MSDQQFIIVGKLGRTRGVNGDIYVTPSTDFPERFIDLERIYVEINSNWEERKLSQAVLISGRPVLHFEGINSPEEAARMTNLTVGLPFDEAVELPEDTFYIFDLVGCKAYLEEDDSLVGEIVDVETYPANDIYRIKLLDGRIVSVPAAREFVKKVEINQKRITVAHVDQLDL